MINAAHFLKIVGLYRATGTSLFILLLLVSLVMGTGCVMKPTRTGESEARAIIADKLERPLEITEKTVVLDTRSAFDYGLNHIANSIHFQWDGLSENFESGEPLRDLRKASLRLSLIGLEPSTPVIVVGYGPTGKGEEGRLAWNLIYLGFKDVQVASVDVFRKSWTQKPTGQVTNAPIWTATKNDQMLIGKEAFLKVALDVKGRLESRTRVIDVRSEKEYFDRDGRTGSKAATVDINALHIPWTEFYTAQGRPNPLLRKRLAALGVKAEDRIILVSQHGVRSSAAAYSLFALGFSRVENFIAGWRVLSK